MSAWHSVLWHGLILIVGLPICCLVPTLSFGLLLSDAEGWQYIDALLYVGGDLVLLPLTTAVPSTLFGRAIDFFCSCVSLGVFGWLLALLGALPMCASSKRWLFKATGHQEGEEGEHSPCGTIFTLGLFIVVVMPAAFLICGLLLGGPLAAAEGWSFTSGALFALSLLAHCPSLAPNTAPRTDCGRLFALLIAVYALAVAIGWVVGIFLLLPAMDSGSKALSRGARRLLGLEGTFCGHLLGFSAVTLVIVPGLMLPVAMSLGALYTALEGWSLWDGLLRVAGNIVLISLTSQSPQTIEGKALDFVASVLGVGLFGFTVALVGALPFVDECADKLGGKREGVNASIEFASLFFLIVLPVVCAVLSLPMGAVLAAAEGWPLTDGWLYAAGIMVQAPGLPPASLRPGTGAGKVAIFVVACWSICISIGWGCGVIVASAGLDLASRRLARVIDPGSPEGKAAGSEALPHGGGSQAVATHLVSPQPPLQGGYARPTMALSAPHEAPPPDLDQAECCEWCNVFLSMIALILSSMAAVVAVVHRSDVESSLAGLGAGAGLLQDTMVTLTANYVVMVSLNAASAITIWLSYFHCDILECDLKHTMTSTRCLCIFLGLEMLSFVVQLIRLGYVLTLHGVLAVLGYTCNLGPGVVYLAQELIYAMGNATAATSAQGVYSSLYSRGPPYGLHAASSPYFSMGSLVRGLDFMTYCSDTDGGIDAGASAVALGCFLTLASQALMVTALSGEKSRVGAHDLHEEQLELEAVGQGAGSFDHPPPPSRGSQSAFHRA